MHQGAEKSEVRDGRSDDRMRIADFCMSVSGVRSQGREIQRLKPEH